MKALADTHVLLWALFDPGKIGREARAVMTHGDNEIWISTVSFWEISLKYQLGKLQLSRCVPEDLPEYAEKMGLGILEPGADVMASFCRLPLKKHKDPFDRLIAWQAIRTNAVLLTKDSRFEEYADMGLETLW